MSGTMLTSGQAPRPFGTRSPMDRRPTSHTVTCDYLVGRGFRVCSCAGSRRNR